MPGIPLLDELMANAWPPAVVERRGGWRLRWTDGVTRRANSVLPSGDGEPIDELVDAAEAFYAARDAPARFQVSTASAPPALVDHLRARGYVSADRTLVLHAATAVVVEATDPAGWTVDARDRVMGDWFDAYWRVEATRGRSDLDAIVCRDVLLAPPLPATFASARDGAGVVATGQIVVERGWAGVQCMTTAAAHRRRGAATAVLHRLAVEAAAAGADRLHLAVMADNVGARAVYERAGFELAHEYAYVTAPT